VVKGLDGRCPSHEEAGDETPSTKPRDVVDTSDLPTDPRPSGPRLGQGMKFTDNGRQSLAENGLAISEPARRFRATASRVGSPLDPGFADPPEVHRRASAPGTTALTAAGKLPTPEPREASAVTFDVAATPLETLPTTNMLDLPGGRRFRWSTVFIDQVGHAVHGLLELGQPITQESVSGWFDAPPQRFPPVSPTTLGRFARKWFGTWEAAVTFVEKRHAALTELPSQGALTTD
jgi:hypothetical protein